MFASNTSQVSSDATYIEDIFSTYLYQGNGSTQTITNGIDLAGKGGMVWLKSRGPSGYNHYLYDTNRGATNVLFSNLTNATGTQANGLTAFNSNGFTQGSFIGSNGTGETYASWTFRKAPKFFDVVTYTGNGVNGRNISHNLGSVPGCIIVKRTDTTSDWTVYHRSLGTVNDPYSYILALNTTAAQVASGAWNDTAPTSTTFQVGNSAAVNANGGTYVAYLFAHNAGGFGLTGTDNVISCGSYTGTGATGNSVTLGFEPQWILVKDTTSGTTYSWQIQDVMRGMSQTGSQILYPDSAVAEASINPAIVPTATGFTLNTTNVTLNRSGDTYIYIAIRRGPMKTPTSGTSVFAMDTQGSTTPRPPSYKSNFPVDWAYTKDKTSVNNWFVGARLTGTNYLSFDSTAAEATSAAYKFDYQNGWLNSTSIDSNRQSWMFRRAPGFFDVVCWSGTGVNTAYTHNLGAAPELVIVKNRTDAYTGSVFTGFTSGDCLFAQNLFSSTGTDAFSTNAYTGQMYAQPTSTQLFVRTQQGINQSGKNYVAYLFASCPGVSKVGSYTGTGSGSQTINCGFTSGARFVMIKRTDNVGDWYVWDSARGITSGNDPYLLLNKTDAEITTNDTIDPDSSGFIVNDTFTDLNGAGNTYIYLAIA